MRRFLGVLLTVLVIVLLGASGAAAWLVYARVYVPSSPVETAAAAERAVAGPDTLLLASVNVRYAAVLERGLPPEERQAYPPPPEPGEPASVPQVFLAAGVDPRRTIDHVAFALRMTGQAVEADAVVLGRFEAAAVESALVKRLGATRRDVGRHRVLLVAPADRDVCPPRLTRAVAIAPTRLVIAAPDRIDALLARLDGAPTDGPDLAYWRTFRADRLLALAVFVPDTLPPGSPPQAAMVGPAAAMLGLSGLYVGATVRPIPTAAEVVAVARLRDAQTAGSAVGSIKAGLAKARAFAGPKMPTLASLVDQAVVEARGSDLAIETTLDLKALGRAKRIPEEILSAAFGGMVARLPAATADAPPPQVDGSPRQYVSVADATRIAVYSPAPSDTTPPAAVAGPAGVWVAAMRKSDDPAAGPEITFEARARGVPNLGDASSRMTVAVTEVSDASGANLLRDEPCGRDRNGRPAEFEAGLEDQYQARKTVRLVPSADMAKITTASGVVTLRLPTKVESVRLSRPAGQRAARGGATVTIAAVSGRHVAYQVSGDARRVLEIRALDGAGRPLERRERLEQASPFGPRSGTLGFSAPVEQVEVFFAVEEQRRTFPFRVDVRTH
jgi:hypothetical protein